MATSYSKPLWQRRITLNSMSGIPYHTGSTFLVEYSTDYTNFYTTSFYDDIQTREISSAGTYDFTGSVSWNTLTLNVGESGLVLIPTGSVAIRLTDLQYPTSQYTEYI
jgi:hypothetical protein